VGDCHLLPLAIREMDISMQGVAARYEERSLCICSSYKRILTLLMEELLNFVNF